MAKKVVGRFKLKKAKKNLKSLNTRATIVRELAQQNPLLGTSPALQAALANLIKVHDEAKQADDEAKVAAQVVSTKRTTRRVKVAGLGDALDFWDAHVLQISPTPEIAKGLGAEVLEPAKYPLVAPKRILATVDQNDASCKLVAEKAAGLSNCVFELSSDGGVTWKPVAGDGATRDLEDLKPGSYLARAAHTRGGEQSSYTDPVHFTMK